MNDQAFSSISGRAESDNAPAPIIVGAPRSGTTLLRLMLDANSQLAIPPETGFLGLRMSEHSNPRNQFFDALTNYPIDAPAWSDYGITQEAFWEGLQNIEPFEFGAGARCFFRLYAVLHGKRRWEIKRLATFSKCQPLNNGSPRRTSSMSYATVEMLHCHGDHFGSHPASR